MSSAKSYPLPLAIPPLSNQHTHTLLLLHGRGSNSDRFGTVFLASTTIARRLPTVKFVFPTAKKRRSTVLNRIPINQWFDNYSLEDPNLRTELQLDGLEQTSRFLTNLIDDEARLLRESNDPTLPAGHEYRRIVIGGLSQGCAASIVCLLGQHKRLGGFVGMSGWLPLEREISGLLDEGEDHDDDDDDDDPFSHDEDEDIPAATRALNHIRDVLDLSPLPSEEMCQLQTPVFLGHGSADPKVAVGLGRRMASVLADRLGVDVTWRAYEDFGHWYKVPDEIDDVMEFLKNRVGTPSVD